MFSFFRRKPKKESCCASRPKSQEFNIPLLPDEPLYTVLSIEAAKKIYAERKSDTIWLDVRSPKEWSNGRVPGAKHIPIDQLEKRVNEVGPTDKKYIVYCHTGGRSTTACEFLNKQGYHSLYNMTGGMGEWDGPVEL
ncbi:MAG: rhodanese-like domain-containing protein [Deltaproteobacteria bacterium]